MTKEQEELAKELLKNDVSPFIAALVLDAIDELKKKGGD
jgi:hypothetical protein